MHFVNPKQKIKSYVSVSNCVKKLRKKTKRKIQRTTGVAVPSFASSQQYVARPICNSVFFSVIFRNQRGKHPDTVNNLSRRFVSRDHVRCCRGSCCTLKSVDADERIPTPAALGRCKNSRLFLLRCMLQCFHSPKLITLCSPLKMGFSMNREICGVQKWCVLHIYSG